MKIAAHTLGCKLNYAETSDLLRRLAADGHTIVDFSTVADLYIVNTCTVTAVAEKKCRTAIHQALSRSPQAQVAVIGCFAQVAAEQLKAIPGVSLVLGNDRKHLLPSLIRQGFPSDAAKEPLASAPFPLQYSSGDRTRVFFKIQDGCDFFCTYCAIPFARGRSRSANVEEAVATARRIASTGAKEVVLTGVNTGTFGQHTGENLLALLQRLDEIREISRFRISSIEPNLLTADIIHFSAQSRAFLPHFHVPLQAGSDHVLSLMHRRYDTTLYHEKILQIKEAMPDACIAADIMAGFNGENEEEFAEVLRYVGSLPLSYLHVFTYSERPGTAALRLGEKIPMHIRRQHTARLLELSRSKHQAFVSSQQGKERPVLWESKLTDGHFMEGWTDNYIRLRRPFEERLIGQIEPTLITPLSLAPTD